MGPNNCRRYGSTKVIRTPKRTSAYRRNSCKISDDTTMAGNMFDDFLNENSHEKITGLDTAMTNTLEFRAAQNIKM